jgi:glyoxylase-like metal-dependent hydrolase (beta-lactamase superfamily II)
MRVTEGIYFYEGDKVDQSHKGYFHYYRGMAASNFLVIPGKRQLMIDSGIPEGPHLSRVKAELRQDKIKLEQTNEIFFSHAHPDHTLWAKKLYEQSKGKIKLALHGADLDMTQSDVYFFRKFFNYPPYVLSDIFQAPEWLVMFFLRLIHMDFGSLKIERTLTDGQVIPSGAGDIVVKSMPAHSPGHVGYYFTDRNTFYSGDLFDLRCTEGGSILAANSNYDQIFKDIQTIRGLNIRTLIPGHGSPIKGKKAISATLDRVEKASERFIEDALRLIPKGETASGVSITELAEEMFPGAITYNAFSRRIIAYHSLEKLHEAGQVDFRVERQRAYWYGEPRQGSGPLGRDHPPETPVSA